MIDGVGQVNQIICIDSYVKVMDMRSSVKVNFHPTTIRNVESFDFN